MTVAGDALDEDLLGGDSNNDSSGSNAGGVGSGQRTIYDGGLDNDAEEDLAFEEEEETAEERDSHSYMLPKLGEISTRHGK